MEKNKQKKYLFAGLLLIMTFIFVIFSLLGFYSKIQKREYEIRLEDLKDFSIQGSVIVEDRLQSYINLLGGVASFMKDGEMLSEKNKDCLKKMADRKKLDFERIGLADKEGRAWVTNGVELNVSQKPYFRTAMENRCVITESWDSVVTDTPIFIVAIPVRDMEEQVKGVLYGVIETDNFRLYQDTKLDTGSQYLQIIDRNGSYIMREADRSIIQANNLFDGLKMIESSIPQEEIISQIQEGKQVLTELKKEKQEYIAYFLPLEMNDWYVVSVMEKNDVTKIVDRLLGHDVYYLTAEIIAALLLLFAWIVFLESNKKKDVMRLYQKIKLSEDIFRIAVTETNVIIMVYDLEERWLKLFNPKKFHFNIPSMVENAPVTLKEHLAGNEKAQRQIDTMFAELPFVKDTRDFEISLMVQNVMRDYRIRVKCCKNEKEEGIYFVGIMNDITEELKLRKDADLDFLTGLSNRRSGTRYIEQFLNEADYKGKTHGIVIMDLDNFKLLNDTLGHQTGDKALQDVAGILRQHFREYDVICRLAGDEFMILIKDIPVPVIERNIQVLLKKLSLAYEGTKGRVTITATAGIAVAPLHGTSFKELYQKADKALYQAKNQGKNAFLIYTEE